MKIGDVLPNGAIVMEFTNQMILAKGEKGGEIPIRIEYITWRWNGEDPGSTWSGNYWLSLANAAKDFEERVNKYARGIYANG